MNISFLIKNFNFRKFTSLFNRPRDKRGVRVMGRGFSLIELSIVIVIISILISGALSIAVSSTNTNKIKNTNDKITKIYQALKTYLATNKRLPCPAPINVVKSTTNTYGTADVEGCASSTLLGAGGYLVYGMVPVSDLNLSIDLAEDDYGSKFLYVVDSRFATASAFGFEESNNSLIQVKEAVGSSSYQINTSDAIFLIISHGANKLGAYPADSTVKNTDPTDVDEAANSITGHSDSGIDSRVYSNFISSSKISDVFDDIVFYKTRNEIVLEANVLDLIYCSYVEENYYSTPMSWARSKYGQVVPSSVACPSNGYQQTVLYPTKKCGAFGNWQAGLIDPCTYSANATAATACTGGDSVATVGTKTIHTFTSVGTSSLYCPSAMTIDYLVVGGGGGGGGNKASDGGGGGGGGGGGVKSATSYSLASGTYSINVGDGGTAGASGNPGTNGGDGGNSSFGAIATGYGGKGGVKASGTSNTGVGGASGVGDNSSNAGGTYGSHGATGDGAGGGGGGAGSGATGSAGDTGGNFHGGAGGSGVTSSISGSSVIYGGGGGGCGGGDKAEGTKGSGGSGGGGDGGGGGGEGTASSGQTQTPVAGITNRGGGGGGGGRGSPATAGGKAGGSGVVIISYTTP